MDEKIIAVCKDDPTYNMYDDICQLPSHTFEEMRHFLFRLQDPRDEGDGRG